MSNWVAMFWEMCFLNVLWHGILHSFVWQGYSGFAIMDYAQGYQDIKQSSKDVYVCQMRVKPSQKNRMYGSSLHRQR
jgi:hypothetical protein